MTNVYECQNCGVISREPQDLCDPRSTDISCRFYDEDFLFDPMSLCDSMVQEQPFSCDGCGRISPDPRLVCSPSKL